jgi:HAE1 family hydrophobic/amphiphilic exporter-1
MTAFAFILGVVPLVLANGAGAAAQNRMGTAVFWGMLVATVFGVFLVPGLFAMMEKVGKRKAESGEPRPANAAPAAAEGH